MIDNFFYCAVYEIIWKNIVEPDRQQMTVWRMHIACWIPKATNTLSESVICIAFPPQLWLRKCATVFHCMYIAHLVDFSEDCSSRSWLFLCYCNCELWKKNLWCLHSLMFFIVCCLASKICNLIIIQLSVSVLGDHMLLSEKNWWAACQTILCSPCIYLVARCSKLSWINLFWYIHDLLRWLVVLKTYHD